MTILVGFKDGSSTYLYDVTFFETTGFNELKFVYGNDDRNHRYIHQSDVQRLVFL